MNLDQHRYVLPARDIPTAWYNIAADLPEAIPPHLNPQTGQPATPQEMGAIFPQEIIKQEVSTERWIEIPEPVREKLAIWRPSPLVRAIQLEKHLKTPARIYYKYEGVSPTGSHKPNSAVAQAYYNKQEGIKRIATETGAGQWGCSLAFACDLFDIECKVYMVKVSYEQKPFRRSMMELFGASCIPSPSNETEAGRALLAKDPNCTGALGIAITEAIEDAAGREDTNYALGSVLNHVCLHQTVIGLELKKQLAMAEDTPDILIGCAGGGSNLAGMIFPYVKERMEGKGPQLLAVEPSACPTLTRGKYAYDYGDSIGLAPMAPMYTLGHTFVPSGIHAGGLRYHGMGPTISMVRKLGLLDAVSYHQNECFEAGVTFARVEGICPAPESTHAVKGAIDEALKCKETGEEKCIVFNLSGHGHFDMLSYDKYLAGDLEDYSLPQENIDTALNNLPEAAAETSIS
ncbi:Tryptophan synthase beta chain [Poriferisphaera corsica]|uniref:Tryptophan synthase beta chain n=1 Tax=Poriferisphaera corsica TaxID=2528020 RepID=A0A517YPT4_9BACT|nr:TrpB-like pyridoxal phosphate-dependent enzyme [Poriferisphaera corsica]QDU32226.1 Tryptophan synthase beta chain [Poriferisphaera corsica]